MQPVEPTDPATALRKLKDSLPALRERAARDPLLAEWSGPYDGVPPWDRVKVAGFGAAFSLGLELLRAEVATIGSELSPATFDNTIAALERAGRHLGRAETLFGVLSSNLNTEDVQALEREWSPKLTAAHDAVVFDAALFARIEAVHGASGGLEPEQKRLTQLTYERFVRAGAKLSPAQKAQLGEINQRLSSLFTEFSNRLLKDEDTFIVLDSEADLAGLPDSLRENYRTAAQEHQQPGKWLVVNTRSSVDPFLAFSARRDLRERVWRAFKSRGDHGGDSDTKATIVEIVKLRAERARLLGYASHAHWRMADTMAKDPENARELMRKVWVAARARVREEVADMQQIADREPGKPKIAAWDYFYYAEKVRKAKYDLDQNQLKPYFELSKLTEAAFYMAEQLYGMGFREITGRVPVFHPEVRVWEVTAKASGQLLGLFYGDYFARATKRSGAWCSEYRNHESFSGDVLHTITSNNNNFLKAGAGEPVLISLDDAQTLFHEFGHAIHGLVSEVRYPGLGETPRDFVE
jgi:peptidyl-dipeptidase Dcp